MRVATFRSGGSERLGIVRGDQVIDVAKAATRLGLSDLSGAASGMLALIAGGDVAMKALTQVAESAPEETLLPLATIELLAPIPRPRKNVLCVGRNYAEHAAESSRVLGHDVKVTEYPNIFTKAVTSVTGPYSDFPYDASVSKEIDWEVELAVIVGRGGRHIAREDAMRHVWGYTVLNDISARDIQHRSWAGVQWFLGKSLDGSCPMGPWIVTADELADPTNLRLQLLVNGIVKQDDTTAHMIFDIAALLAELSSGMTLEPGDIIATGTPSGVGFARTPPEFLRPGDMMESVIEGIGAMRNRVVAVDGSQH